MKLGDLERMTPIRTESVWLDEGYMQDIFGFIGNLDLDELSKVYLIENNYDEKIKDYYYSYNVFAIARGGKNIFYVAESAEDVKIYVYDRDAFDSFLSYVLRKMHDRNHNIKFLNKNEQTNIDTDLQLFRKIYGQHWYII